MSAQSFRTLAASAPKSILKRPAPLTLPLSPRLGLAGNITIIVSPAPGSPHVHFPPSANMTSLFSAHSPTTYNREPIAVSPNPLALPAWGDRVFSPSTGQFRKRAEEATPSPVNSALLTISYGDPAIAMPPKAAVEPSKTRAGARFKENVASSRSKPLPRQDLGNSLTRYPRSPYPSAPMSPVSNMDTGYTRPRTQSVSSATPARERRVQFADANESVMLSPVPENPLSGSVMPETSLSNAFWESVTLSEAAMAEVEDGLLSATTTTFTFGTRDGTLWSPGLPRKRPQVSNPLSMLSPMSRTAVKPVANSQVVLSPTPFDPFSAFPSFSAVLTMGGADRITYPPPVITEVEGARNNLSADID